MKSLLRYFNGYRKECIMGPAFKLLEASFELLIPLVVVRIIDIGIAEGDSSYIIKMVSIMVLLGVIGLVCSLSAQFFSAKAAVGFSSAVREALFKHIQTLSYSEIDQVGTSTLITRITTDINKLQDGVNMTLRLFLRSPFIVFGSAIMAFSIDAKVSMVFLLVIPLLAIVIYGVMIITIPMYRNLQGSLDKVLEVTKDNLSGVRVIRAFGLEQNESKLFNERNGEYVRRQLSAGRISALTNPLTFVIINIGMLLLIYKGAVRVNSAYITQGQLVALINYISQVLIELVKLANFIVLDIKALASAGRIESIMLMTNSMKDGDKDFSDGPVDVVFDNVSLEYKNAGEETLTNISFEVKAGSIIGIIGATGSGKSSLINLIPRFYDVSEGKVLLAGTDVKEYSLESLRNHIAVVPQKAALLAGTIRHNMTMGNADITDEEIHEALKLAMAEDFVMEKPEGLDYILNAAGKNLSGGQRQRLTIARALVKKAKLLLLDDSASALDMVTDAALRNNLKALDYKPTVFIVSQRIASIIHADKIIVLDDGKIVGQGEHNDLLSSCQVYKEIYESQYGGNV